MACETWEYLEEVLGSPDNDEALERSRQLVAAGWEVVGVRFSEGVRVYRRRVRLTDESTGREPNKSSL
jgi:hypothetical protein